MSGLAAPLALVAAAFFALATVLEQRGAMQEPDSMALRPRFLLRLVRKPVWLLGLLADATGYGVQAAALGFGRLIVVQPLLVSSVVLALPLGVWLTNQRIGRREVLGAAAVCGGLVVFKLVATPAGGRADSTGWRWVAAASLVGGLAVLLVLAAHRRPAGLRATLLGTAAGLIFGGLVAALTKATVDRFDEGPAAVFGDWHVYALAFTGVSAFLLFQASLQTGALPPAMTAETVLETAAGVAAGIFLFQERLDEDPWQTVVSLLALGTVVAGLTALSRCRAAPRRRRARPPTAEPATG
jgi:hypothetical protein